MENFRVTLKILTKVLVSILIHAIMGVIMPTQTALLKGRVSVLQ
jgi:hypothetical protein